MNIQKNILENMSFELISDFQPTGDQPEAINTLVNELKQGQKNQVLLGVTGSGKTFTMAQVIKELKRPALIMAPNKTLAAQLYGEMKTFFPNNAVEYFVSYYDYYQPEAYVPRTDTYIEKETSINEQIDRMRHSATRAILERRDVIIVASVSCIYGIGDVETYQEMTVFIQKNQEISRDDFLKNLVELQYKRNDTNFVRGAFRVRGDNVELFPAHLEDKAWRYSFFGDEIEAIHEFDPLTGQKRKALEHTKIFANSHYVTSKPTLYNALKSIKSDLKQRVKEFDERQKLLESQRIDQRVSFDIEMLETTGICQGIENYSRYLTGRPIGAPPPTLFEYIPEDALLFIDESHVTVPQIGGMYKGDFSRKSTLSDFGFRLPACLDNRPLKFEEWNQFRPQTVFVSATPGPWELDATNGVIVEQIIRPTGLIDPICVVKPTEHQIDDLINEIQECVQKGNRVLVTTLTKKMAEDLSEYMEEAHIKSRYLHSDIDTLDRIEIIRELREGIFDVLVGINLLREGLDIPECGVVAIIDADKEGFLRSKTSLIQTIGRAARNVEGKVILYADKMTDSMKWAIEETNRRREIQQKYNAENNIKPKTIQKNIPNILLAAGLEQQKESKKTKVAEKIKNPKAEIKKLKQKMFQAAADLEFEKAAKLRDMIKEIENNELIGLYE